MCKHVTMPLYNFGDALEIGKWYDCECQSYRHEQVGDVHYILYLRCPRHSQWRAHIVSGAYNEHTMGRGHWSDDVFSLNDKHFTDNECDQAKDTLVSLFNLLWRRHG